MRLPGVVLTPSVAVSVTTQSPSSAGVAPHVTGSVTTAVQEPGVPAGCAVPPGGVIVQLHSSGSPSASETFPCAVNGTFRDWLAGTVSATVGAVLMAVTITTSVALRKPSETVSVTS